MTNEFKVELAMIVKAGETRIAVNKNQGAFWAAVAVAGRFGQLEAENAELRANLVQARQIARKYALKRR